MSTDPRLAAARNGSVRQAFAVAFGSDSPVSGDAEQPDIPNRQTEEKSAASAPSDWASSIASGEIDSPAAAAFSNLDDTSKLKEWKGLLYQVARLESELETLQRQTGGKKK